jgi:hypothetical protein
MLYMGLCTAVYGGDSGQISKKEYKSGIAILGNL